jgi:hypothetical protein
MTIFGKKHKFIFFKRLFGKLRSDSILVEMKIFL